MPIALLLLMSFNCARADSVAPTAANLLKPAIATAPASPDAPGATAPDAAPPLDLSGLGGTDKLAANPTALSDQRTQKVLVSLIKQAGWFPNLTSSVQAGIVTLKGHTKSATQLEWLAKTADRLPNVVAVINQSVVDNPPVTDLSPIWAEADRLVLATKKAIPLFALACVATLLLGFLGHHLSRVARTIWGRHISNPFLLSTVSKITMLPIWALFFYLVLRTAGLSALATTIIGGTGAASLVVGFAFKGIAENYLSGLLLAIRSPFTKGDEIQVDQYSGFVQSLNMRGTTIVDYDGNLVLIPNSIVIQSVIRNRTINTNKRGLFVLTIGFHDSLAQALELISAVLAKASGILPKPGPGVAVDKLSPSGVDLSITYWFDAAQTNGDRLKATLVALIKDELLAHGLHIPDSGREVVFADALRVQWQDGASGGISALPGSTTPPASPTSEAATASPASATDNLGLQRAASARERAIQGAKEARQPSPAAGMGAAPVPREVPESVGNVSILRKTKATDLVEHADK